MSNRDAEQAASLARVMKVMAQPLALRLLGAIVERPATLERLAQRLEVSSGHLGSCVGALVATELVNVDRTTAQPMFSINEAVLKRLGETAETLLAGVAGGTVGDRIRPSTRTALSDEEKVVRDFFAGPRLKQIPARRTKLLIVLRHLLRQFDPGRDYPEKEVNAILRVAHVDVATLRRNLVDFGFMIRANGIYRMASREMEEKPEDTRSA